MDWVESPSERHSLFVTVHRAPKFTSCRNANNIWWKPGGHIVQLYTNRIMFILEN